MPIEIFADDRLSKNDIRVLGVILSFRNKDTNLCYPKRQQITERCGIPANKISTITTRLVSLGWLKKEGKGGCSRSTNYTFLVPEIEPRTVTDSVTVTKTRTVTDSGSKTLPDSVTKTLPKTGRGIKQTIKQTNEQTIHTSIRPEIVKDLFNEITTELPKVNVLPEPRKKAVKRLMKIMPAMSDWRRFFEIVEESDFLSGRSNDWNATFDWLLKPANAVKVAEGNYTNKKSSSEDWMAGLED
jgi:hypothetical protein